MTKLYINIFNNKGFSLLELVVSMALFAIILFAVVSSFISMNLSNSRTMADREASENAKRALEEITYEIKAAKSIYTSTTTANQLSLETSNYLPEGETHTFIDFFLCGSAICFKKEGQDAITLTSSSVQVTNLTFSQISTGNASSVQVGLTVNNFSLTSTSTVRTY